MDVEFPIALIVVEINLLLLEISLQFLIGDDTKNISLGPNIPAGIVVCENCGHMEFFAMGSLGLLKTEEHDDDGK